MKRLIYLFLIVICLIGTLFINTTFVFAEDTTDEAQLFSGDTMVSQDQVVNDSTGDELKQKHIGFSGTINSVTTYTNFDSTYDWAGSGSMAQELTSVTSADLFVDIRLKNWVKGFLSARIDYYPAITDTLKNQLGLESNTNIMLLGINEFFIDSNWKNKAYFRTGKQVLKWGQGYFWNPTDVINIEKKDFFDMAKVRQGTFGTKITIPSGLKQNTYLFLGMNDATKLSDISVAGKYEFLVKNTEMSFSVWGKNGYQPVYGFDITGRILSFDYHGEISLASDERYNVLDYETLVLKPKTGEMVPQVCFGLAKTFDYGDIKDRINIIGEFFYNQAGYDKNIIQHIASESNGAAQLIYLSNYQGYTNSKYYAAFFGSINKFGSPDVTFNLNGLMNLVDNSAVLTTGFAYNPALTDIVINFNINGYLGAQNTEATMMGRRWDVNLGAKISF